MDEAYVYVYLGVALVSLFIIIVARRSGGDGGMHQPPGPWQLPISGSLHHLVGKLPHRAMRDLARRHGPVMLLRLGEVPTLVVSSREGACELMKIHDKKFATRPLSATMSALTDGGRDLGFAPYGDYWRRLRKIAVTELFTAQRVLSFRGIREEEVAGMLGWVAEAAAAKRPVEMRARLSALVIDSTVRAVMGDGFEERDVFLSVLDRSIKLAAGFNLPDLWPSSRLAGWMSGAVRCAKECRDIGNVILESTIQEHLERMERDGAGGHREDLLDVLIRIHKEGTLDMDSIKSVITEIFGAGSETATTTLEWAIAELIKNPTVMHKVTAEVRGVFQARGSLAEDALGQLPYLRLVIRETLRLHTPAPLLVPRECQEACQLLGYDVPRGMQVLVNAWALGRDERYWNTPDEFRPERFQLQGDAAALNFKGSDFEFLPFGAGRRMCPGITFALANIELALASLLFHFDWEGPPPDEMDMSEAFGLTARRKDRLLLLPVLRVPLPTAC